jgi:hypothetical protein
MILGSPLGQVQLTDRLEEAIGRLREKQVEH